MKGFGIAIAAFGIVGGAQAFSMYTFEGLAATSGGALSSLVLTDNGLTMTLTRPSTTFDIIDTNPFRGTAFQFPLSWRSRSLNPNNSGSNGNGIFMANFSSPVSAFEFEFGDFNNDQDQAVIYAYSGPNGTGTLLATVFSDPHNGVFPSYAGVGWNNGGNSSVVAQSFLFQAGTGNFPNSTYYDNFAAEAALVPEPATLAALGLGLAAFARRRKSA